eukprot:877217-Amphidinium_carterae.1
MHSCLFSASIRSSTCGAWRRPRVYLDLTARTFHDQARDRVALFHETQATRLRDCDESRGAASAPAASSSGPAQVTQPAPKRQAPPREGSGDRVLASIQGAMAGTTGVAPALSSS